MDSLYFTYPASSKNPTSPATTMTMATIVSPADALLSLIQGPDGAQWSMGKNGWNSKEVADVCSWEGVTCNSAKEITKLDLENSGLTASLPDTLGSLSSLTHLRLGSNRLVGSVPSAITNLQHLIEVDLSHNQLHGSLPVFDGSAALEIINLSYNSLEGPIPMDFGTRLSGATNLQVLDLKYNQFKGLLPESIGELPASLTELDLSHNQLVGTLSDDIKSLTHLEGLYLSHNHFVGPIPSGLGHISTLSQVFLQSNAFSGSVPASLADLPNLVNLFLDGNKLTGTLPQDLCEKNLNEAFFQSSSSGRNLVNRDGCTSIACPVGSFSSDTGLFPCEPCADGTTNPYLGATSCFSTDQTELMTKIMEAADVEVDVESTSVCEWEGVTCNWFGDVTSIVLTDSSLSGSLAPELGFLSHLQELKVGGNALKGNLPSELAMAPLETIDISNNQLVGVVPPKLCEKSGLNGNGSWFTYTCDTIACAVGSYSVDQGSGTCIPCVTGSAQFLGSTTCEDGFGKAALLTEDGSDSYSSLTSSVHYKAGAIFAPLLVSFFVTCCLCGSFIVFQRRRKLMADIHNLHNDADDFVDPEDEVPTSFKQDTRGTFVTELDQFPTSVQIAKSKNAWSSGKEQQTEVWLDVPKIQ